MTAWLLAKVHVCGLGLQTRPCLWRIASLKQHMRLAALCNWWTFFSFYTSNMATASRYYKQNDVTVFPYTIYWAP